MKIFKRKKKKFMYETLLNPKPRIGLVRQLNIQK